MQLGMFDGPQVRFQQGVRFYLTVIKYNNFFFYYKIFFMVLTDNIDQHVWLQLLWIQALATATLNQSNFIFFNGRFVKVPVR